MNITEGVGWIATALVVLTGVPQSLLMLRSRKIDGISLHTFAIYTASGVAWVAYGLLKKDLAIDITNLFVIVNGSAIMLIYLHRRKQRSRDSSEVNH